MTNRVLAMTGATGFVGGATVRQAVEAGWHVRALTRRPQEPREGVTWLAGELDDPESLAAMVSGAEVAMHIAGVVNVPTRAAFEAGNAVATANVVDAARGAGVRRFIHVSSLAAREPELSNYGWSKERAERVVLASGLGWTIVRPPAVFGPGDTEMLDLFRMARRGVMVLPGIRRRRQCRSLKPCAVSGRRRHSSSATLHGAPSWQTPHARPPARVGEAANVFDLCRKPEPRVGR